MAISLGLMSERVREVVRQLFAEAPTRPKEFNERLGFLLTAGPGGGCYLSADGEAWILRIAWNDDEEDTIERVEDGPLKVGMVAIGAEQAPELREWLPRRAADAIDCDVCKATGYLPPPYSSVQCVKCCGLGWLPM